MVGLSTVLYLMVRALPRISEEPDGNVSLFDRWAHSQFPERVDRVLNGFLLKFLRKLKVLVLKFDNTLSTHLEKVKPGEADKRPAIDFREIAGQNGNGNGNGHANGASDASERSEVKI